MSEEYISKVRALKERLRLEQSQLEEGIIVHVPRTSDGAASKDEPNSETGHIGTHNLKPETDTAASTDQHRESNFQEGATPPYAELLKRAKERASTTPVTTPVVAKQENRMMIRRLSEHTAPRFQAMVAMGLVVSTDEGVAQTPDNDQTLKPQPPSSSEGSRRGRSVSGRIAEAIQVLQKVATPEEVRKGASPIKTTSPLKDMHIPSPLQDHHISTSPLKDKQMLATPPLITASPRKAVGHAGGGHVALEQGRSHDMIQGLEKSISANNVTEDQSGIVPGRRTVVATPSSFVQSDQPSAADGDARHDAKGKAASQAPPTNRDAVPGHDQDTHKQIVSERGGEGDVYLGIAVDTDARQQDTAHIPTWMVSSLFVQNERASLASGGANGSDAQLATIPVRKLADTQGAVQENKNKMPDRIVRGDVLAYPPCNIETVDSADPSTATSDKDFSTMIAKAKALASVLGGAGDRDEDGGSRSEQGVLAGTSGEERVRGRREEGKPERDRTTLQGVLGGSSGQDVETRSGEGGLKGSAGQDVEIFADVGGSGRVVGRESGEKGESGGRSAGLGTRLENRAKDLGGIDVASSGRVEEKKSLGASSDGLQQAVLTHALSSQPLDVEVGGRVSKKVPVGGNKRLAEKGEKGADTVNHGAGQEEGKGRGDMSIESQPKHVFSTVVSEKTNASQRKQADVDAAKMHNTTHRKIRDGDMFVASFDLEDEPYTSSVPYASSIPIPDKFTPFPIGERALAEIADAAEIFMGVFKSMMPNTSSNIKAFTDDVSRMMPRVGSLGDTAGVRGIRDSAGSEKGAEQTGKRNVAMDAGHDSWRGRRRVGLGCHDGEKDHDVSMRLPPPSERLFDTIAIDKCSEAAVVMAENLERSRRRLCAAKAVDSERKRRLLESSISHQLDEEERTRGRAASHKAEERERWDRIQHMGWQTREALRLLQIAEKGLAVVLENLERDRRTAQDHADAVLHVVRKVDQMRKLVNSELFFNTWPRARSRIKRMGEGSGMFYHVLAILREDKRLWRMRLNVDTQDGACDRIDVADSDIPQALHHQRQELVFV